MLKNKVYFFISLRSKKIALVITIEQIAFPIFYCADVQRLYFQFIPYYKNL